MRRCLILVVIVVFVLVFVAFLAWPRNEPSMTNKEGLITLPPPALKGDMSVEEALASRRSRRSYKPESLGIAQIAQLLWAGQGITGPEGWERAAPSAGATYPARLLLVAGRGGVEGLDAGVYEYVPEEHGLKAMLAGDLRGELARAALGQAFISQAPVNIVIVMDYQRTTRVYGQRGVRYVDIEVGHIGQNLYLQAEALGLGTVIVGAFNDDRVSTLLHLPSGLAPLAIMPFGRPA